MFGAPVFQITQIPKLFIIFVLNPIIVAIIAHICPYHIHIKWLVEPPKSAPCRPCSAQKIHVLVIEATNHARVAAFDPVDFGGNSIVYLGTWGQNLSVISSRNGVSHLKIMAHLQPTCLPQSAQGSRCCSGAMAAPAAFCAL